MIRTFYTAFALMLSAAEAAAEYCPDDFNCWKGPGWYEMAVVYDQNFYVSAGPFADEATCKASLVASDETVRRYCTFLQTQPSFDKPAG